MPTLRRLLMDLMLISAVVLAFAGLGFFARYFYLDYKSKKDRSFLVVGLGLLAFWFFGGTGLLAIALMLFFLLFVRWCF